MIEKVKKQIINVLDKKWKYMYNKEARKFVDFFPSFFSEPKAVLFLPSALF